MFEEESRLVSLLKSVVIKHICRGYNEGKLVHSSRIMLGCYSHFTLSKFDLTVVKWDFLFLYLFFVDFCFSKHAKVQLQENNIRRSAIKESLSKTSVSLWSEQGVWKKSCSPDCLSEEACFHVKHLDIKDFIRHQASNPFLQRYDSLVWCVYQTFLLNVYHINGHLMYTDVLNSLSKISSSHF